MKDASSLVNYAKTKFPLARIFLLGISEGTYVALQVASQAHDVSGVALIGFMGAPMKILLFEQTVYRSLSHFHKLDSDKNEILESAELDQNDTIAISLKQQMSVLDVNKDASLSMSEFMAGNYANFLISFASPLSSITIQEEKYPQLVDIIKQAQFKILFLQGEWDNQTPAYYAKTIQLLNAQQWKKSNLHFKYYPKLGHILDIRESYNDVQFRKISPEILNSIGEEMDKFFK